MNRTTVCLCVLVKKIKEKKAAIVSWQNLLFILKFYKCKILFTVI